MESVNNTFKPFIYWNYSIQDGALNGGTGSGLNNDPVPHLSNTISASALTPYNFYDYYGFNQILNDTDKKGNGQKIAIIDAYGNPNIQNDLDIFCSQLNLPSTEVDIYHPLGLPSVYNSSWALETNLDVQYAHAMALSSKIILVVSPDATFASLSSCITYAVNELKADVVSMSFGTPENSSFYSSGYDNIFANLSAVYIASSGDYGAQVNYPGSSPNVLSIGGTILTGGTNTSYASAVGPYKEVGWFGSGGGVSKISNLPSYQVGWSSFSKRSVPDVSYNAGSPVSVYFTDPTTSETGWISVYGTSAGAPQWASIAARRQASGLTTKNIKSFNQMIYNICRLNYSSFFYDIKQGTNTFKASYGYDLVSGLGSPKVYSLFPPAPTPTPTPTVTPSLTVTNTPTNTKTPSQTTTKTLTPTNTPSISQTKTPTPSISITPSKSPSPTVTKSVTPTPTQTKFLASQTPTPTPTVSPSITPLSTRVPIASRTPTPTKSLTPTSTPSPTPTDPTIVLPTPPPSATPTNTRTPSVTPTLTPTKTNTPTPSVTPSNTRTNTPTPSITSTISLTPTNTPTNTPSISLTPTNTRTPSNTPTISNTPTNTVTPSQSPSRSLTPTPTITPTISLSPTVSLSPSPTRTIGITPSPTPQGTQLPQPPTGYAYVGFGGSTGAFWSTQNLVDFNFTSQYNNITMIDLLNNNFLINNACRSPNPNGNEFNFTTQLSGGVGNVFYKTYLRFKDDAGEPISWSANFKLAMGNSISSIYADGTSFIIQRAVLTSALGGGGVGLGYSGIPYSIGICFDTFNNSPRVNDYNNNHVEFDVNGDVLSLQTANPSFQMCDTTAERGTITHGWVDYDGPSRMIYIYVSNANIKPATPLIARYHDIRTNIG